MIYAVHIQDKKFVKIGFCVDLTQRIRELQTGNPYELVPLFAIPGTLAQEHALHDALRGALQALRQPMPLMRATEWYLGRTEFFLAFLDELRISANRGIAFADVYACKKPRTKKRYKWKDVSKLPQFRKKRLAFQDSPVL